MGVIQEHACRLGNGHSDKLYSVVLQHIKSTCESQKEKRRREIVADHDSDIKQATTQTQVEAKPAKVQPVAGWKSKPKAAKFDFEESHKDYEERRIKGQRDEQRILKALEGNERACDYVKQYFQSVTVMWDIEKFREHLTYDIEVWTELYRKYGDTGVANYTRSIATAQTILQVLK